MADHFQLLQRLPEELRQDVIERLEKCDLASLNLASRLCHQLATPLLWRDIKLQDCQNDRYDDHHDDTPLLGKLLVLTKNEWIGSCVNTLTHSCHLPPPALFLELPATPFCAQSLSADPRTAKLVQLAVKNMTNVQTLRIIFGHPNINDILLRCFFDKNRPHTIRRLWLENCRISVGCSLYQVNHPMQLPMKLNFTGLESVRFRRLPLRPAMRLMQKVPLNHYVHSRGDYSTKFSDGAGGWRRITVCNASGELGLNEPASTNDTGTWSSINVHESMEKYLELANVNDDRIYESLAQEMRLPPDLAEYHFQSYRERSEFAKRGRWLDPDPVLLQRQPIKFKMAQREMQPSSEVMLNLLDSCSATLTNLCLDWVSTVPYYKDPTVRWKTFTDLFALRFPNLKAFQFRNAIVPDTVIPPDLYLLGYSKVQVLYRITEERQTREPSTFQTSSYLDLSALEFMEAHPNLQCLAWPMDAFFPVTLPPSDIIRRVEAVVDNLGRNLVDLRVDAVYSGVGEPQSENTSCPSRATRERRRRFISDFAAKMSKVESIKIEGGVPRDERRETVRALYRCPLKKIVMIGVNCPVGNTWGASGRDLNETLDDERRQFLEAEHKDATHSLGVKKPELPDANFRFEPYYGWPPQPPMLHTVASLHAENVRELKLCGWKGAPVLFTPTPITNPMLAALKHFHNLESLILSMWLNTEFEEAHRDSDIVKYWLEARSPASTSLVRITDEEPEGWEKELRTKYAPDALAWWITNFVGQFLSERAKTRRGGVHVRVSICIGERGGIFDIDLKVGKESLNRDVCLGYKGPREELEPERRKTKLESRRWF